MQKQKTDFTSREKIGGQNMNIIVVDDERYILNGEVDLICRTIRDARVLGFTGGAANFTPEDLPGFENFPTQFGVRYEPLRRIADSPEMPRIRMTSQ